MLTKTGFLYLFDISSGKTVYTNRVSATTPFISTNHSNSGGIVTINGAGQVLLISVDENTIVPYLVNVLNDIPLAITIASRCNLPGAEELFVRQFNQLFQSGDYQGAARVAFEAPSGILRTPQTIQFFKSAAAAPGQPPPLIQYFNILLEKTSLTNYESLELARPVIQQGRKELLENWFTQEKLGCSEELGDLVHPFDVKLALGIYNKAEAKHKVIACFAELGEFEKMILYSKKASFTPEWGFLLQNIVNVNPAGAAKLASLLLMEEGGSLIDVNAVADLFFSRGLFQEATAVLLEYLKADRPEDSALQTKLLEVNVSQGQYQLVEGIFVNEFFHHYDKNHIAHILERAGMHQRALQHFTEPADIKRVIVYASSMTQDFLFNFFNLIDNNLFLDCLRELFRVNRQQNLQLIVSLAVKFTEKLSFKTLTDLFESFQAYDVLYLYLGQILPLVQDPEIHFKFIEAAVKLGKFADVEKVVRESNSYDAERVRDFLKEAKLPDPISLIIVCDRFGFVDDLTKYFYDANQLKYIEIYVQKVNPNQTPSVIAALLDVDCNEDYIRNLLKSVGKSAPVAELVSACEKRGRLKILFSWLEDRVHEGSTQPATHNALAKIFVDTNRDPELFLRQNQFYDSLDVGKYCESRDPNLAFIAFKRGLCDAELIDLTNRNNMFRPQAKYVVERQNEQLWATVLDEANENRRSLIDQVIQTALPESRNPEEVSSAVRAFMTAKLPHELMELLEKIVVEGDLAEFSKNRNLQNLLILTAIKSDPTKVLDYIHRLDNFDAADIATIAINSNLFEEAFAMFSKAKLNSQAVQVLIQHIDDIKRAHEFAELVNENDVWSKLAHAQLQRQQVKESIDSFIRASDHQYYLEVIRAAEAHDLYQDLTRYLLMCRKMGKDPQVETALVYAYAKTSNIRELTEFISSPNCAQIQQAGERCFNEGLYEAAKVLFNNISNYARLASTLVKLKDYSAGVEAARKANNTKSWKEVCLACVDAEQFRLAQICGLYIIIHPIELEELIKYYEERGHFDDLIGLVEAGLHLERSHAAMFVELAILYSKYRPEKLMEHLRLFCSKFQVHNLNKIIRTCEKNHQWQEVTFLFVNAKDFDNAALTMMNHSPDAWDHLHFKEIIPRVANLDVCYKAVQFYFNEHPSSVNDLLGVLISRVDHKQIVNSANKNGLLPLIKPYLLNAQQEDAKVVNQALNQLFIEEEDYQALRNSINTFNNFDNIELAKQLANHELLEFRRIAAYLYKKNKYWEQSINLSKADGLWKDATQSAADSKDPALVESLLRFFASENRSDCFAALTYICHDLVQADVVLELAWANGMIDFAMPFMIQTIKNNNTRLTQLEAKLQPLDAAQQAAASVSSQAVPPSVSGYGSYPFAPAPL